MPHPFRGSWFLTCLLISAAAAEEAPNPPAAIDFSRDVQPILAAHCTRCHGPDKREGGLRLDLKAEALTGGDSGAAIVPGKPEPSPLMERVTSSDESDRMPPEGARLSDQQIARLRQWIAQGATWPDVGGPVKQAPDHWSFRPVVRPPLPDAAAPNPVDRFVRARLAAEALAPSGPADRHTLLRRLSLDLTGLPPTIEEVRRFVADDSPAAYEQQVDRLLASPHFGERWAIQWLDLARYADSDGYEKDLPRPHAYRWRDWLIEAINRDLPFDQFTVQQLAGDLLPGATNEVRLATGFHRNTLTNREGGVDQEEFRVAEVVDRTSTTFTAWTGLTVGCAQCHSHKYDPLTQREFYSLYAFFNDANEADLPVDPAPEQQAEYQRRLDAHQQQLGQLTAQLEAEKPQIRQRLQAWAARQRQALADVWKPLEIISQRAVDASTYEVVAKTNLSRVTGFRLQLLPIAVDAGPGPWTLSNVQVAAQPAGAAAAGPLWLSRAEADTPAGRQILPGLLAADATAGWQLNAAAQQPVSAWFATAFEAGQAGWLGNPLVDGSQDGATNLLNVYYQSPVTAPGTIDKLRVFTKATGDANFSVYLLRRQGEELRVVARQEFTADGRSGQREYTLNPAWQVQPGDVFAHSGNGGPTYVSGDGTRDVIYFPVGQLPAAGQTVPVSQWPKIASRTYALQASFVPAAAPAQVIKPQWDAAGATLTFRWSTSRPGSPEFRLAATDQASPLDAAAADLPGEIAALLPRDPGTLDDAQWRQLFDYYLPLDEIGGRQQQQIAELEKKKPAPPESLAHVIQQGSPRPTHVHLRGDFLQKGDEVQAGTPAFLPPLKPRDRRPDRLDLARWLVDPANPLTTRVAVNHVWAMLFGRGLVRSTDDFGTQGEQPSHPELLDWLAAELPQQGWSRKRLIRLIVLSETYRQSSQTRQDLIDRDPENRLLARQNRFRLDAELVRDQYLAAAGLLNRRVGGPSFRPALPESVTRVQFVDQWKADTGETVYRRGMYIQLQRNLMLPMLMTFDRPDAILTCTRRDRSNTPLQALTLLNHPTFVESAQALAAAVSREAVQEDAQRIVPLFLRTVSRPPSDFERARVQQLLDELSAYYAQHSDEAQQLAGSPAQGGAASPPVPLPRQAAWVAVCRTVLNLDEVITRE